MDRHRPTEPSDSGAGQHPVSVLGRFTLMIRKRDWSGLLLEVAIVFVGVYAGLYATDQADQRKLRGDVDRALHVLQLQLTEDLASLDRLVVELDGAQSAFADAVAALASPEEPDAVAFAEAVAAGLAVNRTTFFPNRSGYQAIRDRGYLAEVENPQLLVRMTHLFESAYDRLDTNSALMDDRSHHYGLYVRDRYWDRVGQRFLFDTPSDPMRLRNGAKSMQAMLAFYQSLLISEIRPALVDVIEALAAYRNRDAGAGD